MRKKEITYNYTIRNIDNNFIINIIDDIFINNSINFKLKDEFFLNANSITLDLSGNYKYDSYLIVFIDNLKDIAHKLNCKFEIINLDNDKKSFFNILRIKDYETKTIKDQNLLYSFVVDVGRVVRNTIQEFIDFTSFFGAVILKTIKLIFSPRKMRWVDFPDLFIKNGIMALPISALIVFLIGLISGYQGALQLSQFGADIFIADLVGISLTRELSPIMVAILVAGRSGSSFAAQLGTMKVSEEINALETMGFDKLDFLIMPRIAAVTTSMPFLVLICNIIGIFGGLIAALATLDITISSYINRLQISLSMGDIFSGLIKSLIFGFLISIIGCYKGLTAQGGADSVGKITTASVVAGVFVIILVDAVFTFLLTALGL